MKSILAYFQMFNCFRPKPDPKPENTTSEVVEYADGIKIWYLNGKRHRVDGPAIERPNGINTWYLNGLWHRVDGPAGEDAYGSKYWYQNGRLHRVDGPAYENPNGNKAWSLDGVRYSEEEHYFQVTMRYPDV